METSEVIVISENGEDSSSEMEIDEILPKNNITIADQKNNQGNDHYKEQNYEMALKFYSDAISLCPDSAAYYGNRSAYHMMLADYKSTLYDARTAIQIDDKFENAHAALNVV